MSAQTTQPSTTVATQETKGGPVAVLQNYSGALASMLPSHLDVAPFMGSAIAALHTNPDLMNAAKNDVGAFMAAVTDAARQGLMPGTKEYYLTIKGKGGNAKVLGVRGYQGEIELIYRAGAVSSVKVEAVHEHDEFAYSPSDERPRHTYNPFAPRGKVIGAYAYAVMKDGSTSKVVLVGPDRIERARKASATAGSTYSPWSSDEAAMVMKTAVHDLTKWVPTSAEYRREQIRAERDVAA